MIHVSADWSQVYGPLNRLMAIDQSDVDSEVGSFMKGMRSRVKGRGYPAKRLGQTYIRTGIFANSWATMKQSDGWHLVNKAEQNGRIYPAYVIGDELGANQAWMHEGRWWTFLSVLTGEITQFELYMQQWLYKFATV